MDEILWHRRETRRHRENKPRPVAAGASGLLEKSSRTVCGEAAMAMVSVLAPCAAHKVDVIVRETSGGG
jgi:hypothetical protein